MQIPVYCYRFALFLLTQIKKKITQSDWMVPEIKPLSHFICTLVCKNVLCFVSQFVQIRQAGVLDHWWRTAQHHEDVAGRSGEMVLDHVTVYKPCAVPPI